MALIFPTGTLTDGQLFTYSGVTYTYELSRNIWKAGISNITGTAATAADLVGGVAGSVPYQSALSTTEFVPISTSAGQILTTVTAGGAPTWQTPSSTFTALEYVSPDKTKTITSSMLDYGTLSFSGSAGQLFSITNSLSGSIFSVNDVSGIPSIEVLDTGAIKLAQYGGNVGIGNVPSGSYKLEVSGSISGSQLISNVATGTAPFTVASTTAVANLSIGGNAATVTTIPTLAGEVTNTANSITLSNSAVIGKVLTGYVSGAGTVAAADSILGAIQKLNGNTPIASSTIPAALGTAAAGSGTTFARADHVHQVQTTITGNAATATTATTATNQSGGTVSATTGTFSNIVKLTGGSLQEVKTALAANNVDISLGNYFTKTITAASTLTVSNVPATGTVASFILDLTNGGAFAVTWWAGMKWAYGTAPTLTASGRDILGFFTHDAGTTWNSLVLAKDIK